MLTLWDGKGHFEISLGERAVLGKPSDLAEEGPFTPLVWSLM